MLSVIPQYVKCNQYSGLWLGEDTQVEDEDIFGGLPLGSQQARYLRYQCI